MNSKPNIKNIVFDLGNIIVDVDYRRFTNAMDWPFKDFWRFYESPFFRKFEIGKHTEIEFFRELEHYIPLDSGDEQRYRDNIHLTFPLRAKTWGIVHWLQLRHRLFLFSNTNSLDFNGVNAWMDLRAPFEAVYTSHEQGYLKPDVAAYRSAETLFRINPSETVFFDDHQENIDAARAAGWNALRIDNEKQLIQALQDYNFILPDEIV
ncbi:MAG: HAD-IA family hydrolase [Candidatus Marinimicrobia bacterium]|nr:HAD-IA family hydrolase [Candidatus Neomarinimicrobiota bacterium]